MAFAGKLVLLFALFAGAFLPAAHAAPLVSIYIFPPTIDVGGTSRLQINIYDFAPGGISGGTFALPYPAGVVNAASPNVTTDGCTGTLIAPAAEGGISGTSISIPFNSACTIEVDIRSSVVGLYTVTFPASAFFGSTGFGPGSPTSAVLAVTPPLVVTSLLDSGPGTLRQVIEDANATCATYPTIRFGIAGVIAPTTNLPAITCPGTLIDGATAPGHVLNTATNGTFDATLPVHLDFSSCGGCGGLSFTTHGVVRGLAIYSYSTFGVLVDDQVGIYGNVIGTQPGTGSSRGGVYGVHVRTAEASIGGGTSEANVITGNQVGVYVEGSVYLQDNLIGGDETGSPAVGNSAAGVKVAPSGYGSVFSNFVRYNGGPGIVLEPGVEFRTLFSGNSAHGNAGPGIDLGNDGPTANDEAVFPYDQDSGPNGLFNYPVVTSVAHVGADTVIQGYLKTWEGSRVEIELYHNSSASTPAVTHGERRLDIIEVDVDGAGVGTFTVTVPNFLAQNVSATASLCGDGCFASSEYSPTVAAGAAPPQTVVTNTESSGPGSLIDAINFVNANCATNKVITFNVPGTGILQIQPLTPLPILTCDGTVIDGYTQPNASENSLTVGSDVNLTIEIDGSDVGGSGGFRINAPNVVIKGLALHSFHTGAAITVIAPVGTMGIVVQGNFIGLNMLGTPRANQNGIVTLPGAAGLRIGGNEAHERNVIASNNGVGINLASGDGTQIINNYIGVDPSGTAARPNREGIAIGNATNTYVGYNVISANRYEGASAGVFDQGTASRIEGNLIGTDALGVAGLPNDNGIVLSGANGAILGNYEAPNLISGNNNGGVRIDESNNVQIRTNYIGTSANGIAALANGGVGIEVATSTNVTIGNLDGDRNVIGFNSGAGVNVVSGNGVAISRNSIFQNAGGKILLGGVVPANDACDTDGGPNDRHNSPELDAATTGATGSSVTGTATGGANSLLRIEFFAEPAMAPGLGRPRVKSGEPRSRYLGAIEVDTGPGCSIAFNANTLPPLNGDDIVSATATDASSNTSPFSNEVAVAAPPPPELSCSILVYNNGTGDGAALLPGDAIVTPGGDVGLGVSCSDFTGATFLWNDSRTDSFITVTGPAAGANAIHSVTVTTTSGTTTASKTLRGAGAAAPLCTIAPTINNPVPPGFESPFDMVATCAPGADAFAWHDFGMSVVAGQGTSTATYLFGFMPAPGYGYTIVMTPSSEGGGPGPDSTRLIWVQPLTLSTTSLAFPNTTAGTASAPLSITVTNVSDYYQAYADATITGPFTFTTTCPEPLTGGNSCTLDVRFEPAGPGSEQSGVLTLSTGFPGNSDLQVFLSGNGTPGAPSIAISASSLTFAARTILTTSSPQTVTFSNDGNVPFNFETATTTGDFAVSHDCGSAMPPGDSCGLDVTFTPLTEGPRTGQLRIHTDLEGSPHVVSLSGAGVANTVPSAALIPGTLEFAPQLLGTQSAVQFITVLNDGTAPLAFGAMSASGDFALVLDFTSTFGPCGGTLAPGAQCEIGAAFRPTVAGVREGRITINTNAPEPVSTLRLVGTGLVTAPARMLSVPSSLAFDAQRVGTRSPGRPLAITNNFPSIASITELTATGDFSVSDTCTTVPARGSCAPLVTFLPRAVGPRSGTLTIRALSEIQPYVVQLTGLGQANPQPALEASITQASFGNAFVGAAGAPVSFNLRNIGQVPVVISGIAPRGDFFVTHACATIAAGDSCQVTIFFAPHAIGRLTGSLFVHSNAEASPLAIGLSGIGCSIPSAARARFGGVLCGP